MNAYMFNCKLYSWPCIAYIFVTSMHEIWSLLLLHLQVEGGLYHPLEWEELLCLQQSTETATVHVLGQDGRGKQFDTTCSLISAPQWHCIPHNGPS